jgi:hypothetical protein
MKQVISVKDLEEMLRNGKDVRSLPADALLTPSARDIRKPPKQAGHRRPWFRPAQGSHRPERKGRHRGLLQLAADP